LRAACCAGCDAARARARRARTGAAGRGAGDGLGCQRSAGADQASASERGGGPAGACKDRACSAGRDERAGGTGDSAADLRREAAQRSGSTRGAARRAGGAGGAAACTAEHCASTAAGKREQAGQLTADETSERLGELDRHPEPGDRGERYQQAAEQAAQAGAACEHRGP